MKKLKLVKGFILAIMICLLWSQIGAASAFASQTAAQLTGGDVAIPAIIERTTPSVVAIIGKPGEQNDAWGGNRYNLAHGTGVIVQSDGYIVTNAHVVKDMRNIVVVTSDGHSYSGKTTHYDEESDLALVKIEATGLTPATFASAADIHVGETVMAIGTPLSFALRNSVTVGIVSGMERAVKSNYQLIQTDAAINPGNSGGALVNMNGQVIGINSMKFVQYGVDSLGFAIPVDTVKYVLDHFFKYGKVKRPYIGLELSESWEAVVGLPAKEGLEVSYVDPDSPSAKAGIKQGDVLVSIENEQVRTLVQYHEALKKYLPGQTVRLGILSDGKTVVHNVELGENSAKGAALVQNEDGAYIDADQGKTKIGDSHFGWSMKYPAGLMKGNQSSDGDSVNFADSAGDFDVYIMIEERQSVNLSQLGLMKQLADKAEDTVLEKRYVEQADQPYAKLVGKTEDGEYYQIRAFHKEDKIYYLFLYVKKDELYNNDFKRKSYEDLLDTFKLAFDSTDTAMKDISVFQTKNTVTTNYGLAFDIPSDWTDADRYNSGLYFASKDQTQTISVEVTSASSGDTLKDWASRQEKFFLDSYVQDYRESSGNKETTIAQLPAVEGHVSSTMGDKWRTSRAVFLIKDKYKYQIQFTYPKDDEGTDKLAWLDDSIASIRFSKDSLNGSLGFIQDEDDLLDLSKTVTYTNKTYKYEMNTPEFWYASADGDKDSERKAFSFGGGSLIVEADDRSGLEDVIKRVEQAHKKSADADADYKYEMTDETLFDTSVKKIALTYKTKNVPYTLNEYVFNKNGITYTVRVRINDAVKTEANWERLNNAVHSLTFLAQ